jgi:hypothetical protein
VKSTAPIRSALRYTVDAASHLRQGGATYLTLRTRGSGYGKLGGVLLGLFLCTALCAQSCLVLSPATIGSDGTATFELSLYSPQGSPPASVQWTLHYSTAQISRLSVDDGPRLAPAGKTTFCNTAPSGFKCQAVGTNRNTIGNGPIALITAVLTPGTTKVDISMTDTMGASPQGYFVAISSQVMQTIRTAIGSDCRPHMPPRSPVRK